VAQGHGPRPLRPILTERSTSGIYLARHGQTAYNLEGRFQGQQPVPLDDTGREQAAELAERAAGYGFATLWCSPLLRAQETAAVVAARIGLTPREDARLMETGRARFARGILVALSNPKTIVFFTAFLPQFLDPKLPAGPQLVVMCVVTVILAGVSDCAWAVAAGMGRAWFMKPKRVKLLGRLSGTVLIGGGLWLSLARRSS